MHSPYTLAGAPTKVQGLTCNNAPLQRRWIMHEACQGVTLLCQAENTICAQTHSRAEPVVCVVSVDMYL